MWSLVYPGSHVYQWASTGKGDRGRKVRAKLDCSKLVPSSESVKTLDEQFNPGRCQVASMALQADKLYVGTGWGCLIVADAASMRPVAVCRPYAEEIQAILPVTTANDGEQLIVTLGKGYRSLIGRFVGGGGGGKRVDDEGRRRFVNCEFVCVNYQWD